MDTLETTSMLRRVRAHLRIGRLHANKSNAVRTTRARIIHLKNDYKDLMNRIEAGLHAYHASAAAANASRPERQTATTGSNTSGREALEAPFAKVNSVVPDSPADTAGLKAGDSILRFGTATWMNHEKLSKVAEVVSQNEGVSCR